MIGIRTSLNDGPPGKSDTSSPWKATGDGVPYVGGCWARPKRAIIERTTRDSANEQADEQGNECGFEG
jgi:hypothetical protein